MEHLLPSPDLGPDAGPYWDAAKENRFVIQQCNDCDAWRFFPSHLCPSCGSDKAEWKEASGKGTIHSYTEVYRGPTAEFRAHTPYMIVLVDLEEGPRIMTNLIGENLDQCQIGAPVEVCFEDRHNDSKVPQFRLSNTEARK